jgi:hemerythrin-like domain-containing protein
MTLSLASLYADHRSISAVLDTMQHLVRRHDPRRGADDVRTLRAILYYLDVFPERHHHRMEEDYLFPAIRARTHEADAVLDALQRQHEAGAEAIRDLEQKLLRYAEGGAADWPDFASAAEAYVGRYEQHMRLEEDALMPVAQRLLGAEDWRRIEAQFDARRDPLAGVSGTELLHRIVAIAAPPFGTGPARE